MTDDFLNFAYCSLTSGQKDIIDVKYHIAKNMDTPLKDLVNEINELDLNYKINITLHRVRSIRKYEIPVIVDKINYESDMT